ncbi:MAG: NAD(P)-dependent oxidoreductase [Solirubrobacterales bacterium]
MSVERNGRIGLLGTGLMGTAMAHRLLDQSRSVIAWDRNPDHSRPLGPRGAKIVDTAAEVVSGADAVITMLPTADVVLAVVEPLLDAWPAPTIWLQMSSVGAAEADRLAQIATAHGVTMFDAPVSGSTHPASAGQLTILASGPEPGRDRVEPVFAALGSRVQWVGDLGMGSRLKLAANHWMVAMVTVLAETMHLCGLMGLRQDAFVTLLDGGPLGSSYGVEKLGEMQRRDAIGRDRHLARVVEQVVEQDLRRPHRWRVSNWSAGLSQGA